MKSYLRLIALLPVVIALSACGEKEQTIAEELGIDIKAAKAQLAKQKTDFTPTPTPTANPYESNDTATTNINYEEIISSEQGKSAIEAGKSAVITTISGIDKERVKEIAASVMGQAGNAAKKHTNGDKAAAQGSGFNASWKTLSPSGVRVIDGDTIEAKYSDGRKSDRVRLVGIDAPESSQAYGSESKRTLQACVDGGDITIRYNKEDAYGRLLGVIMSGSKDCNFNQVHSGSAWHYKQYQKEQPTGQALQYSRGENTARTVKQGLWANSDAIEPWKYRKGNS